MGAQTDLRIEAARLACQEPFVSADQWKRRANAIHAFLCDNGSSGITGPLDDMTRADGVGQERLDFAHSRVMQLPNMTSAMREKLRIHGGQFMMTSDLATQSMAKLVQLYGMDDTELSILQSELEKHGLEFGMNNFELKCWIELGQWEQANAAPVVDHD